MTESALAFPHRGTDPGPRPNFGALPADWTVLGEVPAVAADRVVVGPNGVFTVVIDADPRPTVIGGDGLYRDGSRVTTSVKRALGAAFALRGRLGDGLPNVFPYPLLALYADVPMGFVGRLRVLPVDMAAEAVWTHLGRPLLRSERLAVIEALGGRTAG
jgi:hypothetical protein